MTRVHITRRSSNSKVGKIPVTTSEASTCPTTCGMYDTCYAKTGPQSWHWNKVTKGERGGNWDDLTKFVSSLNAGQLWRHNISGDLPHVDGHIDLRQLFDLVQANKASGAKGYTYTHHLLSKNNKPVHHNIEALKYANRMVSPLTPAANHSLRRMMQLTEDYQRYVLLIPTRTHQHTRQRDAK